MRIAICDDEKEIRNRIAGQVRKIDPAAEIFLYQSGEELLKAEEKADILFLDIQMPGINGMETAREIRKNERGMIIIFITALEEYVFEAFDVGAFHYLVKPFTDGKLADVFRQATNQHEERSEKKKKYLMVQSKGIHERVLIDDIIYAEVFNRKVVIHKMDDDIEYYGKMSELQEKVGEGFFRPHRAYLVNFRYIVKYDASVIYLEKGKALMAKQKYPEFVKKYLQYNRRTGWEL